MENLTVGEQRVRTAFNPSNDNVVDELKQLTAGLINLVEEYKEYDPRLCALAQTAFEEAAMWGVKLLTANK